MTASALRPGTVIDGYEVLSLLGRGGMGAVYRVRRGDAEYALKTLALEADDDSEEVHRFRREAELLGSLRHPSLVRIANAGRKPGFFYFVMRLVEGESLEDRLKRTGPLPESEAVRIGLVVAEAIAHAHEKGIVHRDLKPANVLMEKDGDRPVVTDFGLGRRMGESESERLTRTGEILGTPGYVAPEQAFGIKTELDEKTDVYGLGALLYALLAGRPPFEGASALVIMKKVSTEPPPPLGENVSPGLETFVRRAMAKRREDRPSSARAFIEELQAVSHQRGVSKAALGFAVFALVLLAATALLVKSMRGREALPGRVAALRKRLGGQPLQAARAEAARDLAGTPGFARRRFLAERTEKAQQAFAAGSWGEAYDAALDCWLAAPDPPRDMEAILIASLAETAAIGSAPEGRLFEGASPEALPAAKEAISALIRARSGELVAAASTSSAGWATVSHHCRAAELVSPLLPDDCEKARLAAHVISGASDDPRFLTGCDAASLGKPPLSLAVSVLYAAALSAEDGEPRQRALERLEKLPPPAPYNAAVSDFFWRLALQRYVRYRGTLTATFTNLYVNIVSAPGSDKAGAGVRQLTSSLAEVLHPLGRAYAAQPDRAPFPEELTELLTTIRLMTNNTILMEKRHADGWNDAIKTLGDHPIALYVRGRLLASLDTKTPRARWPDERVEEVRALTKAMSARVLQAHKTDHIRALALHFVEKILFDEEGPTTYYKGAIDDAPPLLEVADTPDAWWNIASCRKAAGDAVGEAAANERARIRFDSKEELPDWLLNSEKWVVHQTREHP